MECKKQNWKIFIFQWDILRIERDKTPIGLHREGKVESNWRRALRLNYEYNVHENLRLRLFYDYFINKIYDYDYNDDWLQVRV